MLCAVGGIIYDMLRILLPVPVWGSVPNGALITHNASVGESIRFESSFSVLDHLLHLYGDIFLYNGIPARSEFMGQK